MNALYRCQSELGKYIILNLIFHKVLLSFAVDEYIVDKKAQMLMHLDQKTCIYHTYNLSSGTWLNKKLTYGM
jgi:hypothetical protein